MAPKRLLGWRKRLFPNKLSHVHILSCHRCCDIRNLSLVIGGWLHMLYFPPTWGWFTSTKGRGTAPTVDWKGILDGFWNCGVHIEGRGYCTTATISCARATLDGGIVTTSCCTIALGCEVTTHEWVGRFIIILLNACWAGEWIVIGFITRWTFWVTIWFLELDGEVATWLELCWFKSLGRKNSQVVGMDVCGTICGRVIGGKFKSNQHNWIKYAKGRSNPTMLAKDQ